MRRCIVMNTKHGLPISYWRVSCLIPCQPMADDTKDIVSLLRLCTLGIVNTMTAVPWHIDESLQHINRIFKKRTIFVQWHALQYIRLFQQIFHLSDADTRVEIESRNDDVCLNLGETKPAFSVEFMCC